MIAAVIVTYNRKDLLAENIKMLLCQTKMIDKIYIVDNCSTDGTYEALYSKGWITDERFKYVKTEMNIGGAGGFSVGTQKAYEEGADWIILMDDDGKCTDCFTIEKLMNEAEHLKKNEKYGNKLFINALVHKDDMLSFKIGDIYTVAKAKAKAQDGILMDEANPFNGTAVSRELVTEIGYPNRNFFIKGDEVDYKQRSRNAGACIATVCDAMYTHPRPDTYEKKILGKKVPFFVEAPWKEYYASRNFTYMYKENKWYKAIAFELIFVKVLAIFSMKCKKIKTLKMLYKGVIDGWKGKLGPTVRP